MSNFKKKINQETKWMKWMKQVFLNLVFSAICVIVRLTKFSMEEGSVV